MTPSAMKTMMTLAAAVMVLMQCVLIADAKITLPDIDPSYTNTAATRSIDLVGHIVRVSIQLDVQPAKTASGKDYAFTIPLSWTPNIAWMKVSIDKQQFSDSSLKLTEDSAKGLLVVSAPGAATGKMSNPFKAKIEIALVRVLNPLPAEIAQDETQSVKFALPDDVVGIITPYATQTQTTSVTLPTRTKIHKRSQNPKPTAVAGTVVKYGPYSDKESTTAAMSAPLFCHFEFSSPMFVFTNMLREYEISHWGNLAVEDHFDLVHTGATLVGGFSRALYTKTRNDAGGPSFRTLKANLPVKASDIYYRDVIGNISTSAVKYQRTATELDIETRFPIFGGWKTSWYQGYNVPLSTVQSYDDKTGKYSVKLGVGIPFDNAHAENLKIKIILPQFSSNVDFKSDIAPASTGRSERHTFLDIEFFEGRPVIVLDYKNLVSPEHDSFLTVTYELKSVTLLYKPLYVSIVFFLCCAAYIVSTWFSSSDSKRDEAGSKKKQKSL